MHRKTPILDPRSSVTPDAIDLKLGTRDYVVGATRHAKNYNNRSSRGPPAMGWNIMFKCFFIFLWFLVQLWRTHFWEYRHRFLRQTTCSGGDWFPRGVNFNIKHFPILKPQKHEFLDPIFGQKRFIMGRLISKLSLIVTGATEKLYNE